MKTNGLDFNAVTAPNQFVETNGRRLAYRSIGVGKPIVLCTRFRGNMDVWDPAFLDALAAKGFRVITFDYSGLGLSTGEKTYDPVSLARDAKDLIENRERRREMGHLTYTMERTALLFVDPYNDFLSEGGKLWPLLLIGRYERKGEHYVTPTSTI